MSGCHLNCKKINKETCSYLCQFFEDFLMSHVFPLISISCLSSSYPSAVFLFSPLCCPPFPCLFLQLPADLQSLSEKNRHRRAQSWLFSLSLSSRSVMKRNCLRIWQQCEERAPSPLSPPTGVVGFSRSLSLSLSLAFEESSLLSNTNRHHTNF